MANNFELQTMRQPEDCNDVDDIGEYEEVIQTNETSPCLDSRPKFLSKLNKEHDFFTKYDMNESHCKGDKKKKAKKKIHKPNLMDIINSELALIEVPMDKNVITTVATSRECYNLYVKTGGLRFLRSWYSDIETGCKRRGSSLQPIFPNLDQIVDKIVPVEYVDAREFNNYKNVNDNNCERDVRFLDIHLIDIKVKQFHKISLEELLVEKVLDVFSDYNTARNTLIKIANDVKLNRNTKNSYAEELIKITDKKEDIKFDPTLRKYMNNVMSLKHDYIECFKLVTTIFNKIVTLWSDIETIRIKHNYRRSPYDIEINKVILSDDEYESEYNEIFEIEYSDLLDKIEYDYVTKYLEYKEQKYHNKENRSAKKNISKPKLDIDVKEIQDDIKKLVSFLVPKEKFEVTVTYNKSILDKIYKGKMKSNKATKRNKLHFKIYVDDMFVCDTEQYQLLEHDCEIKMLDSFSVHILPHNKTISLYLNENYTEISVCMMNIINIKNNIDIATVSIIPFEYKLQINANHKHIGCDNMIKDIAVANGVRLKSANLFNGPVRTVCHARIQIGWNQIGNQNYSQEYQTYLNITRKIKDLFNDSANTDMLSDVIDVIYDTTVVENKKVLNALKNISKPNIATMKNDNFFVQDNSFDIDRCTLLHMRNLGEFSSLQKRLIPIQSSQISTEQLNILQKIKEKDSRTQLLHRERCSEMHPVELQRYMGSKYIENLNKKTFNTFNEHLMQSSYDDVVRDFKDISIRSFFIRTFKRDVKLSSSIFPNGKPWSWWEGGTVEIYVTALRAFNLPDRAAPLVPEDDNENDEEYIAGFRVKPLRPFVKINCQDVFVQTVTAVGCHPSWNQTLPLKIKDGAAKELEVNIYDEVKEDVSDAFEEGSSLHSRTVHYRYSNKWLGSVTIPIHAVLNEGKLQGTFKIASPPVTIGYDSVHQLPETQVPNLDRMIKKGISYISLQITSSRSHVVNKQKQPLLADDYVLMNHINDFTSNYEVNFPMRKLCLTFISSNGHHKCVTQFLQPISPPNPDYFPRKMRLESAMSKSSGFSKSSSTKSSDSKKNDSEHIVSPRSVEREFSYSGYEGRYAKKVDEIERTINGCLRYVSLIPHYEINEPFNVTLMGLELLKTLYGSSLDHTLLLASYFLHLNIKIWVIVGLGLPRGQSSYVLVKYDKSTGKICLIDDHIHERRQSIFGRSANEWVWCLFDASSGDRVELMDSSCPLKTVLYVFDDENIWVNIQSSVECESVSFDFSRTSEWQPVFDKNVFTMKMPPITDLHIYNEPADVEELRQKLEAKIKTKIQKWRSHMKTVWNRYCGTLLRECLHHWEVWSFNPTETKPSLGHRMRQLMVSYKIFGFPLNFPYTNLKTAVRRIKATLLHDNEEPGVEFGLAVEIFSYPNGVLNVWVFLVSITRQ